MSDIQYKGSSLKVSGAAELDGKEFEHGDEIYVIGRVRVGEVAFPEKDGSVTRVHKAKMAKVTMIKDSEYAESIIAKVTDDATGQQSIYHVAAAEPEEKKEMSNDDIVAAIKAAGETPEAISEADTSDDEWDDDDF